MSRCLESKGWIWWPQERCIVTRDFKTGVTRIAGEVQSPHDQTVQLQLPIGLAHHLLRCLEMIRFVDANHSAMHETIVALLSAGVFEALQRSGADTSDAAIWSDLEPPHVPVDDMGIIDKDLGVGAGDIETSPYAGVYWPISEELLHGPA